MQSVFALHFQLYIIVLPLDSSSRNFRHLVTLAQALMFYLIDLGCYLG